MSRICLYPGKRREVSDRTIISWAQDALATDYMRQDATAAPDVIEEKTRVASVEDAVAILHDMGVATFESEDSDIRRDIAKLDWYRQRALNNGGV